MSKFEYGRENRFFDQYFVENGGAGTYGPLSVGPQNGAVCVTVAANGTVTANASTLKITASKTVDGTFEASVPDVMLTMTGTYQNGEVMGQLVVPNTTPDYIKAVLTTGTALTGKVDIYLQYLAR